MYFIASGLFAIATNINLYINKTYDVISAKRLKELLEDEEELLEE